MEFTGGKMINASISCMYQWSFAQDDEHVYLFIPLPEGPFDTNSVQASLSEEGTEISVRVPDEVPIIEGSLYYSVKSFTMSATSRSINIILEKDDAIEWPYLIANFGSGDLRIDPKSSFELFQVWQASESPEQRTISLRLIDEAISAGYTPALMLAFHASLHGNRESRENGLTMLAVAAHHYEDPLAMLTLGNQLAMKEKTRSDAFDLYRAAAMKGALLGYSMMGQLISPLSDIKFHHKDAKQAADLFEIVVSKSDDPIAMSELAKLLYNGVGVPKDTDRAVELHQRAKALQPELPPLIEMDRTGKKIKKKEKHSPFLSIYQTAALAAFGCAGLYVFYRIWKNRQKVVNL